MTDYYKEDDSSWVFKRRDDILKTIQILQETNNQLLPLFDSSEIRAELSKLIRMKKGDLYLENNTTRI